MVEVEEWKKKGKEVEGEVGRLRGELGRLGVEAAGNKRVFEEVRAHFVNVEKKNVQLEGSNGVLVERMGEWKGKVEIYRRELAEFEMMKVDLECKVAENEAGNAELMAQKGMHEVLEGDFVLLASENGKLKEKIDSLEKNLNSEKASFDMLKITHETTKTELANAGIDLTATKKNLASKKEENLKLKSELQKEMTTTASKDKNLKLNSSNLAKIQEKIQKLESDNQQKSLLLKKNETEMQKTQNTLETHQKSSQSDILIIKKLENSVSNFTDIISSLNEELESLTNSNEELSTKLQASQTKTNEQSRYLLEQKDQCSKLQTELLQEAKKSSAMLFTINEKDTNEEILTKKLASIKEHLGIELGKTEYQESRLAELIAKSETDGNEITELSQKLEKSRLWGTEQGI